MTSRDPAGRNHDGLVKCGNRSGERDLVATVLLRLPAPSCNLPKTFRDVRDLMQPKEDGNAWQ
jgi:hypothetical protein